MTLIKELTGLHEGIPAADYHGTDACSASRLKDMRRSPAHCRYAMDNPKESDALAFGQAFHCAVLEPELFADGFAVEPDHGDCRFKENKSRRDAWRASHEGKTLLTAVQAEAILGMRNTLDRHAGVRILLDNPGRNELSGFWNDPETGILCKLRADRVVTVPGFGRVCVDLKTCESAAPEAFSKAVVKWGYALQAAHYLAGLAAIGEPCDVFVIAAVEKTAPYAVGVYGIDDPTVEYGEKMRRKLLNQYAACVKSGVWPAYSDKIETINVPEWEFHKQESE